MTQTVIRTFHPLDPLNTDEFRQAASILRRDHGVGDRWRFASIQLAEPSKQVIAAFEASATTPDRRAIIVCFDRDSNSAYKAVVSLSDDKVLSWTDLPGVPAELDRRRVGGGRRDASFPSGCGGGPRRDAVSPISIWFSWTPGPTATRSRTEYRGRRLGWSDTWRQAEGPGANPYANPIRGLHCIIDVNSMELLQIEEGRR